MKVKGLIDDEIEASGTDHLLNSPVNAARLLRSIKEAGDPQKPQARVKLFNFKRPRRKFGRLEMDNNRLLGAKIKPDGDAV